MEKCDFRYDCKVLTFFPNHPSKPGVLPDQLKARVNRLVFKKGDPSVMDNYSAIVVQLFEMEMYTSFSIHEYSN